MPRAGCLARLLRRAVHLVVVLADVVWVLVVMVLVVVVLVVGHFNVGFGLVGASF